ncbi:MAG: hypothetical protein FWE03_04365 [Firmicutes bacterium]|nr:hypothetical protein [Bacillota bacterium]
MDFGQLNGYGNLSTEQKRIILEIEPKFRQGISPNNNDFIGITLETIAVLGYVWNANKDNFTGHQINAMKSQMQFIVENVKINGKYKNV